ncbi:MAG TPA: alpha/beta hydrolase [Candidatus Limnocylindria bacterium]|nr:alpha/beta hydrolase [Candidatus Limnocylindria bacterium]
MRTMPAPLKEEPAALESNPSLTGMARMVADVPFTCEGQRQLLTLVLPARPARREGPGDPFVVFLQGSAWTVPDRHWQLPQLCAYAQQGVAVASIGHRDCLQGNPFPGYLKDAKAAIRFLRSEASSFGLDPARAGFFGTSSGGNTALLVGLTGDDPRYRTDDYAQESDAVAAVVDCFGPADLVSLQDTEATLSDEMRLIMTSLIGDRDIPEILRLMSPLHEVRDGAAYPPFLIAHGDRDSLVSYVQSVLMHRRLKAAGADTRLVRVMGGEHESSVWSARTHGMILDFFKRHL